MTLLGVDVSEYQGTIDWAKAAAAGVRFAIVKATFGNAVRDPRYAANFAGARAAGLLVGAYHWLGHGDPASDADAYLAAIGDPRGLLCAVDVEDAKAGTDIADVRGFAARFAARAPGHPLVVYTGAWYWRDRMGNPDGHAIGPLWDSYYPMTAPVTLADASRLAMRWTPGYGGWSNATLLQFASTGHVPGIAGNVDVNAFDGDEASWRALSGEDDMRFISASGYDGKALRVPKGTPLYTFDGTQVTVCSDQYDLEVIGTVDGHTGQWVVRVKTAGVYSDKVGRPTWLLCRAGTLIDAPPEGIPDGVVDDLDAAAAALTDARSKLTGGKS